MKSLILTVAFAVAAMLSLSDTAEAWHWVYRPYLGPRVIARPIDPVVIPTAAPIVTPEVVVGPHGHLHYVRAI